MSSCFNDEIEKIIKEIYGKKKIKKPEKPCPEICKEN